MVLNITLVFGSPDRPWSWPSASSRAQCSQKLSLNRAYKRWSHLFVFWTNGNLAYCALCIYILRRKEVDFWLAFRLIDFRKRLLVTFDPANLFSNLTKKACANTYSTNQYWKESNVTRRQPRNSTNQAEGNCETTMFCELTTFIPKGVTYRIRTPQRCLFQRA